MRELSSASPAVDEWHAPGRDAALFVRRVSGGPGLPALLTVHGGPGISHETFGPLESLATDGFGVVSYDQRAVGRSGGVVDEGRVFAQALEDLAAVDSALGARPLHLLGHSYGGLIAALYAAAHPERLASLVLVDSIPPTSAALAEATALRDARLRQFQARGLVPADLPGWEEDAVGRLLAMLPIFFVDPRHPGARSLGGARPSAAANRAAAATLASYDVRSTIARIAVPTLHFIAPVPFGPAMATAMADEMCMAPATRVVLTDAGHMPWIERSADFFSHLSKFIRFAETKGART
jgi:proline iminopeptidase